MRSRPLLSREDRGHDAGENALRLCFLSNFQPSDVSVKAESRNSGLMS